MTPTNWQRIEPLYHGALAQSPEQRAAWLVAACEGDVELHAEVARLVSADKAAQGFLSAPALALVAEEFVETAPIALLPDRQIGHYRVLSHIGSGGMGEVYLARDLHLGRQAALKLLPAAFTTDADRLRRFEQEARAASALNHPNILTIYEIGVEERTHFIATEFVDGETLRQRLKDGALPLAQTLDIAVQLASALAAAHDAGIVHRDIKPENVMVRRDGLVKVLDFGIAKLMGVRSAEFGIRSDEAETLLHSTPHSALRTPHSTAPGVVLGTPQYMSPEQASNEVLDGRSDLFSLGVVLYEMLAGRAPFSGVNVIELLAATVDREPVPMSDARTDVPPGLANLIHRALHKAPESRYPSAQEMLRELQDLKEELSYAAKRDRATGEPLPTPTGALSQAPVATHTTPRATLRRLWWMASLALVLGSAGWWLAARRGKAVNAPPPSALKIVEVARWRGAPGDVYTTGKFSPDGRWVIYVSSESGNRNLWLKQLGVNASQPIQVTKDAFRNDQPVWSPNGEEAAFYSLRGQPPGGIWRMPFLGGQPTLLKAIRDDSIHLIAWLGKTIYYEASKNFFALSVDSGKTTKLNEFDMTAVIANTFSISPDEMQLAYAAHGPNDSHHLWVRPMKGGAPFSIATEPGELHNLVWHPDNERIVYTENRNGIFQLCVANVVGSQPVQLTFGETDCFALDVARDGKQILYSAAQEDSEIWGVRLADGQEFDITSDLTSELWPDVAPDGKTVAFQSTRHLNNANRIYEGALMTQPTTTIETTKAPFQLAAKGALPVWSPDGKHLAFTRQAGGKFQLWMVRAEGGDERRLATDMSSINYGILPYQRTETHNYSWSPDGNQIVYSANRNGLWNLWLAAADGSRDSQLTDKRDHDLLLTCPLWTTDGQRIVYTSRTNKAGLNGRQTYGVWLVDAASRVSKLLLQSSDLSLRLVGWMHGEQEVLLATVKTRSFSPVEVMLTRLSLTTGTQRELATLPATYFYNIHLSADQKTLAFTRREDGKDNIWLLSTAGGTPRKLTANQNSRLYFSSLAWDPKGKAIYFGKQTRHNLLTQLTNFK